MTKIGLIQFILLFLISAAYGQKVKYKDLYALLSSKQYEQAEPFLRKYLKETVDNPSALLFMGAIYQDKASHLDVLKSTDACIANLDSAIIFYDKAVKILDEKELKRNKEYYEAYSRRDLRTGEYGVKLSDIQFDLEKKNESIKERISKLKTLRQSYDLAVSKYARAQEKFLNLRRQFASQNQLLLRADEEVSKQLASIAQSFDSCTKAFDQYRSTLVSLGKTGYNQKLALQEIADFKADGGGEANFFADQVRIWDFKSTSSALLDAYNKEIVPMRAHLLTYDMEINKLREKLEKDSVSVRSDLTRLIDKLLSDQLKKYDAEPLPMLVFALKTTDLEYKSAVLEHRAMKDLKDIHVRLANVHREMQLLGRIDSIGQRISDKHLSEGSADYAGFIDRGYGDVTSLKKYIQDVRDYASQQRGVKSQQIAYFTKSLDYIVDGADSVSLTTPSAAFHPLLLEPEKYTAGVVLKDTTKMQGYFYTVNASRTPEVKAYFPLSKQCVRAKNPGASKALVYADAGGQIFYVLVHGSAAVKGKFPATLVKIYRSDGLSWKLDSMLPFTPQAMEYDIGSGELRIRNADRVTVVDKNGKLLQ